MKIVKSVQQGEILLSEMFTAALNKNININIERVNNMRFSDDIIGIIMFAEEEYQLVNC